MEGKNGVCRIEVSKVDWQVLQPWQRTSQKKSTGSGFVIDGERLITNAHVVKSAVDIRVRPHGSTRRYPAQVLVYAPDVDLALLEIKGEEEKTDFFGSFAKNGQDNTSDGGANKKLKQSMALEFAEKLPSLQESVHVVGFPTGGKTICVTEGVVSRIDLTTVSGFNNMVTLQVDSAINAGNSGGPAFNSEGKVTGVAFLKRTGSSKSGKSIDNIGYLIPAMVVQSFLKRCNKRNQYTLSPAIPYRWHSLENKSLRLAHAVPESVHGVLITGVCQSFDGILMEGDVLTKIDGKEVADDGQVILRGEDELIQHAALLLTKNVDEPVSFSIFREGKHLTCEPRMLLDIPTIVPRFKNVDALPEYLILGALVLLPVSWPLRTEGPSGKMTTKLLSDFLVWHAKWPHEWDGKDGLVVMVDIFSHELSFSYSRGWRLVNAYNGTPIRSLSHLSEMWEQSCQAAKETYDPTFARLELDNDDDVVFEVKTAIAAQSELMEIHQIPQPSQILPQNPKYTWPNARRPVAIQADKGNTS